MISQEELRKWAKKRLLWDFGLIIVLFILFGPRSLPFLGAAMLAFIDKYVDLRFFLKDKRREDDQRPCPFVHK